MMTTTIILRIEKPISMFKKIITFASFVFVVSSSYSQFYNSFLPSPEFNSALEKIVDDFRYNFKNI
jgi:glycogen synthase